MVGQAPLVHPLQLRVHLLHAVPELLMSVGGAELVDHRIIELAAVRRDLKTSIRFLLRSIYTITFPPN